MRAPALSTLFTLQGEAGVSGCPSLLARLRRGEAAAIGQVYDQHHAAVRAFARRLVGDDAAAEDLLHEVFLTLPRAIERFQEDSSLRTFLVSIAVNHARHHIRAAVRRRAALEKLAREPGAAPPNPEAQASHASLAQALSRAMDALPDEQRVAFVLCEVEERTSREVAQIVGAPEATVRTRVFRARQKLRAMLEREGIR